MMGNAFVHLGSNESLYASGSNPTQSKNLLPCVFVCMLVCIFVFVHVYAAYKLRRQS